MSQIVLLAALLAVVLWGASPVATKVAVADLSPIAVAMLRTVIGGFLALPIAILFRIKLPRNRTLILWLLLSGFCGFIGFPMLFSLGVRLTSANHASMILAALPIFTGAIAMALQRRWPSALWWIGCAVALIGEAILISGKASAGTSQPSLDGDLLVLGSNLFASLGYVLGGKLQQANYPSTGTTFYGAAGAAILLLPITIFLAPDWDLRGVSVSSWAGVAYLAIVVTILGYVLWYWALGRGGIARIGLIQFLQPISGVALAALLLGEETSLAFLGASAVILFGVFVAMKGK